MWHSQEQEDWCMPWAERKPHDVMITYHRRLPVVACRRVDEPLGAPVVDVGLMAVVACHDH